MNGIRLATEVSELDFPFLESVSVFVFFFSAYDLVRMGMEANSNKLYDSACDFMEVIGGREET